MSGLRALLLLFACLLAGCAAAPDEAEAQADVDVEFVGTTQLSFRLRRVIEDPLIEYARDVSSQAPLFDATLDLQDHLVGLGFPNAEVSYTVADGARPKVTFAIREGPRVTVVGGLHLEGNATFSDDELEALWPRTKSGLLGTGDPWFVQGDLELTRATISEFYDARGFLDVEVKGPIIVRADDATEARVSYVVTENVRYRVARLTIAEDLPLTYAQFDVASVEGKPFVRSSLEALRLRARTLLQNNGYPDPLVTLQITIDRTAHEVIAHLAGQPGPRAQVVAVRIHGNERTADHVVQRQVRVRENTRYDASQVEATVRGLYGTGLFGQVEVRRTNADEAGKQVALDIAVHEVDAREIDFLAGYGSYETLRGGVFYSDRNLFGLGQRFQVGARASLKGQGLSATWIEPHLFGSDTSLTIGGHAREREEPTFVDIPRGFDVALARDLWGPLRGRIGYSLQSRDGSEIDSSIGNVADTEFEIGSVFGELVLDRRDSPLYPSAGYRLSAKLEHAADVFGGSVNLDRVTWSAAGFHTFTKDWVLGLSMRAGVIWTHDALGIPVQERFYNGGESTVRSFDESEVGPLSATGTPTGGALFNTLNAELRFPIVAALHGALFADAGNVGLDPDRYDLRDARYALGGGLRLVLPIGPVRLDGAVNPDRRPGEETWVLHLSVGLPF